MSSTMCVHCAAIGATQVCAATGSVFCSRDCQTAAIACNTQGYRDVIRSTAGQRHRRRREHDWIDEHLVMGDASAMGNAELLEQVDAVVSILHLQTHTIPKRLHHLYLPLDDHESSDLGAHLETIYQFIVAHGRTLVHCHAGQSRSGAAVIYYYARKYSVSLTDAIAAVVAKRPEVSPNDGFLCQLERTLAQYHRERVGDVTILTPGRLPNINIKSKKWEAQLQLGKTPGVSSAEMAVEKVLKSLAQQVEQHGTHYRFTLPVFLGRALHVMSKLNSLAAALRHPDLTPVPDVYADIIRDFAAYQGHEPVLLKLTHETWTRNGKLEPRDVRQFQIAFNALDAKLRDLYKSLDNRIRELDVYYKHLLEFLTRGTYAADMGAQLDYRQPVVKQTPSSPVIPSLMDAKRSKALLALQREIPKGSTWRAGADHAYETTALESMSLAEYEARHKAYIRPADASQCSDVATGMANWNMGLVIAMADGKITWVNQKVSLLIMKDTGASGAFTVNGIGFTFADQTTRELHDKLERKLLDKSLPKQGRCAVK